VDAIELEAWKTRAVEANRGDATRMMNACMADLDFARTAKEIKAMKQGIGGRFSTIEREEGKVPLKIGLVGEATVLRNRFLNHNVEEILGGLGAEVRNFFLLGEEIKNIFNISLCSKHSWRAVKRLSRHYLTSLVGGHAIDSVGNTIRCAHDKYDGVVHISPTGCMPEISIRPILKKVSQDMDIPVLECSFDEHTSHVGFVTRLEAFADILYERRKRRQA